VVICLERGADLHMAQLIPLPLTVSCSSKIQIFFTFLVPVHLGSPGQRAVKRVCVCVLMREEAIKQWLTSHLTQPKPLHYWVNKNHEKCIFGVRAEWLQSLSSRKTDSRCIKMIISFNDTIIKRSKSMYTSFCKS